jgi:hypothetical protein
MRRDVQMGRSSVDDFWRGKIEELTANSPKLGPKAAAQRFEKDPECAGRDDWPSESTIGRYQRAFRKKDPAEQVGYRWLYWPQSFEEGALPWEAAAAVLEILRFYLDKGMGRPRIAIARWFWRLTQAAPDAPVNMRSTLAQLLHGASISNAPPSAQYWPEAVEGWLAYGPWRSEEAMAAYETAGATGRLTAQVVSALEGGLNK